MSKVLILGAGGMLGSMVARVLGADPGIEVTSTARRGPAAPGVIVQRRYDARRDPLGPLLDSDSYGWVVNAIGVTSHHIDPQQPESIEHAIAVNALFPHRLAAETAARGQRVIQIATDGVYSGEAGPYDESAPHDATDVYGKTKSLGEVAAENVFNLRCSIVGPELGRPTSLLGWALSAPSAAELTGYTQHRWNGITTLHFAKLCAAVIGGAGIPSRQHVVPADSVTKAELLELMLAAFGRSDVAVRHAPGPGAAVDRTLSTRDPAANERLWRAAGYSSPPTIGAMLDELAAAGRHVPAAGDT